MVGLIIFLEYLYPTFLVAQGSATQIPISSSNHEKGHLHETHLNY